MRLKPPTPGGRLWPRYDAEADLLEVSSHVEREWPYGVEVGGAVIFDLDAQAVLANFDVLVPRRLWDMTDAPDKPSRTRGADLEFTRDTLREKSFALPLRVMTDAGRRRVLVTFGQVRDGLMR